MPEPEPEFQRVLPPGNQDPVALARWYALWVRGGLVVLLWTSVAIIALSAAALVGYAAWRMFSLGLHALG
jgi:hypothetical protein